MQRMAQQSSASYSTESQPRWVRFGFLNGNFFTSLNARSIMEIHLHIQFGTPLSHIL